MPNGKIRGTITIIRLASTANPTPPPPTWEVEVLADIVPAAGQTVVGDPQVYLYKNDVLTCDTPKPMQNVGGHRWRFHCPDAFADPDRARVTAVFQLHTPQEDGKDFPYP